VCGCVRLEALDVQAMSICVCMCVCIQPDGSNALQLFTAGEISHTFEVLTCGCVLVFFPLDLTGNTFSSLITHTHADMRPKKSHSRSSLHWRLYVEKLQVSLDHSISFSPTSECSYDPQLSNSIRRCKYTGALVSIPKT